MSEPDGGKLLVNLNFLGTPVSADYVECIFDGDDHSNEIDYRMMQHVLEFPPTALPRAVLERYAEISTAANYIPIFPVTDKIFERLLLPLKSAKRCFSFGEYLATIELCAHVGEMLATLLWEMTPVRVNNKLMDESMERELFGRAFESQGQEQRIRILKIFGAIKEEDAKRLDDLRKVRRKYFHLWSGDASNAKQDALASFRDILCVAKNVLGIQFEDGHVRINPLLQDYVKKHSAPRG